MKARVYHIQVNVRDAAVSLPFWKALLGYLEYRTVLEERDIAGFSNGTTDLWLMATDAPTRRRDSTASAPGSTTWRSASSSVTTWTASAGSFWRPRDPHALRAAA